MPYWRKASLPWVAAILIVPGLPSCMTAAIFTLPEPKTRSEEIRNDWATAALPVAVTYDIVTLPAWLAVGFAGRGIAELGCGLKPNAVKDSFSKSNPHEASGKLTTDYTDYADESVLAPREEAPF